MGVECSALLARACMSGIVRCNVRRGLGNQKGKCRKEKKGSTKEGGGGGGTGKYGVYGCEKRSLLFSAYANEARAQSVHKLSATPMNLMQ